MNVTDIYVKLRLEQFVASRHLAILHRANIIISQRDGKFIHYALNHARIASVTKFVNELVHSEEANSDQINLDDYELKKVKKQISDLGKLVENWDEEGGAAINVNQIKNAISFIDRQFAINHRTPYFIAPTVNSGVLIEFTNNSKRIDVRFEKTDPYMTIFDNGELKYIGIIDQRQINAYIK